MTQPFLALVRDRHLQALALMALLSLVLGFLTFTPEQAITVVVATGYWFVLGVFVWFAWALWQLVPIERWKSSRPGPGSWQAPALIAGCGLLLLVHESYGFKILMDEIMLLGTSQGMHVEKQPVVALRGHDLQGAFQLLQGQLDKRPLFHPFLISVLHDLTGYRPENAFVLNTALTFVLLTLGYLAGCGLVNRAAGMLVVLLLASLPLLAQNATGGGFELLNLVMILTTLLLGLRYAERRDAASQRALLLASVLLAQTRYESILFLLPVGVLVLWVWWKEGGPVIDVATIVTPLLFVPAVLHQKIFTARESSWELASRPGYEHPFSLAYIPENFPHWLNFFFDPTGGHSNSLVLSVLGWLALPFVLLATVKSLACWRSATPVAMAQAAFMLGFAAHSLLMLCYFWGRFDDPVIRRLSLPLNLWLVLGVVSVTAELLPRARTWTVLASLVGLGFVAHSLPAMARHDYTLDYYVGREMAWRREFIARHPERDYLFIDKDATFWVTHQVSATPVQQSLDHKEMILFNFRNRTFTALYVFQRFDVDPVTGRLTVQAADDLGPDYRLETYWERRFTPLTVSRISRVVKIEEGATARPVPAIPRMEDLSPQERERTRKEYFENLVKRLP